jgi:hypothetical protein
MRYGTSYSSSPSSLCITFSHYPTEQEPASVTLLDMDGTSWRFYAVKEDLYSSAGKPQIEVRNSNSQDEISCN